MSIAGDIYCCACICRKCPCLRRQHAESKRNRRKGSKQSHRYYTLRHCVLLCIQLNKCLKRFNPMFRRALLLQGFCRRKYKAGSLSRMSVLLRMADLSDAALESLDFKQDILQPKPTRSRGHRRRASSWKPFPRTPLHMVASRTSIYRCCIGTAIEVDARRGRAFISGQGPFRLHLCTAPFFCRFLDSA